MTIGIYFLEVKNLYYIGQSVSIEKRIAEHKRTLRLNEHFNKKMQTAFNLLDDHDKISWGVLEECSIEQLDKLEKSYISEFNSVSEGLNITKGGESLGSGLDHPNSTYSRQLLYECLVLLQDPNNKMSDIGVKLDICKSTIHSIANGTLHIWLKEEFPIEYDNMLAQKDLRRAASIKNTRRAFKIKPFTLFNAKLNIVEEVSCIKDFARKYNLNAGNISNVKNKVTQSVGGWRLHTLIIGSQHDSTGT